MSRKTTLLLLSVVSAILFVLPATASATPAHIDVAQTFTVSPDTPTTTLRTTTGEQIQCHQGVTGHGTWHTTTTGTLTLEFHNCTTSTIFGNINCTTHTGEGGTGISGTVSTTHLPFHLIMVENNKPGVLITSAGGGYFAHFTCAGVQKTVGGNGVIGTITSPECDVPSKTATLTFEESATTGLQKHTTYTGVNYHLESPTGTKAAQISNAWIHFPEERTITCTPVA